MRFFWSGLREDIKKWVEACAHCVSYNVWKNRTNETHFSLPVTVSFWIIHVDLWSPGDTEDADGNKIHLLKSMYDLSQFIVSSITTSTEVKILAQIFMSDVIMIFGMCSVVVIDSGSPSKCVFVTMGVVLKLNYCAYLEVIIVATLLNDTTDSLIKHNQLQGMIGEPTLLYNNTIPITSAPNVALPSAVHLIVIKKGIILTLNVLRDVIRYKSITSAWWIELTKGIILLLHQ